MNLFNLLLLGSVLSRSGRVKRLINATPTTAFPWMVYLEHEKFSCGGTLYTTSLVITAAHNTVERTEEWLAYPGIKFMSDVDKPGVLGKQIIKRINHPGHLPIRDDYDVSVWWIKSDSRDPTSVVLGKSDEHTKDQTVYMLGWGTTNVITRIQGADETGPREVEDQLQIAEVPLRPDAECKRRYPIEFVKEIMFCIGEVNGGPAAGVGDSGGPVYRERDNKIILMGVISFAKGCGYKDYKDVIVRVSAPEIAGFIDHHVVHFDPANLNERGRSIVDIPRFPFTPPPPREKPKKPSYWSAKKRKHDECL